jgi:Ni/Co efflux regulator RcnB
MKRSLMVAAAVAAFAIPAMAPLTAVAQDGGRRGGGARAEDTPRPSRPERPDRPGRRDRAERSDRSESNGGGDRPERPSRPDTSNGGGGRPDRPSRPDSSTGGGARPDRPERPDTSSGGGNRPGRPDGDNGGGYRPDRPDRPQTNGGGNRPDRPGRPDTNNGGGYRPDRPSRPDTHGGGRPDRRQDRWNDRNDRRDDRRDDRQERRQDRREYRDFRNRFNGDQWRRNWNSNHGRGWWRNDRRFRGYTGLRIGFYFAPGYGYYSVPRSYWGQRYHVGDYLPSIFWRYQLDDWRTYGLGYPPEGTRWVLVDNHIYLIDQYDGYIIDVIYDAWSW